MSMADAVSYFGPRNLMPGAPPEAGVWAARLTECLEPVEHHRQIAEHILLQNPAAKCLPFVVEALAQEIWIQYRSLVSFAWCGGGAPSGPDNMLYADGRAIEFLEKIGPTGKKFAERMRPNAIKRWTDRSAQGADNLALWTAWYRPNFDPCESPLALAIAGSAWCDIVKPKFDELQYPAVSMAVLRAAHDVLWKGGSGTTASHRLFRWILHHSFAHYLGSSPKRELTVRGGYSRLAAAFGLSSNRAAGSIAEALQGMRDTQGKVLRYAPDPWLEFDAWPAAPNRQAVIVVRPSDLLWPNYVNSISKNTAAYRQARKLVPVPATLPPLAGRRNEHAAACALQLLVLAELRTNAQELHRAGCANIGPEQWFKLTQQAGLTMAHLPAILASWEAGDDDAPAMLQRVGAFGYTLAPAYAPVLRFILEGARLEREGLATQRASRKRKQARAQST